MAVWIVIAEKALSICFSTFNGRCRSVDSMAIGFWGAEMLSRKQPFGYRIQRLTAPVALLCSGDFLVPSTCRIILNRVVCTG
jgi:hypothetical protein